MKTKSGQKCKKINIQSLDTIKQMTETDPDYTDEIDQPHVKRAPFNSWAGKRGSTTMRLMDKRAAMKLMAKRFSAWARKGAVFTPWTGKRADAGRPWTDVKRSEEVMGPLNLRMYDGFTDELNNLR